MPKQRDEPRRPNVNVLAAEKTMTVKLEAALAEVTVAESDYKEVLRLGRSADVGREAYRTWSAWAIERVTHLHYATLSMVKLLDHLDFKIQVRDAEIKVKNVEIAKLRVENDSLRRLVEDLKQVVLQVKLEERFQQLEEGNTCSSPIEPQSAFGREEGQSEDQVGADDWFSGHRESDEALILLAEADNGDAERRLMQRNQLLLNEARNGDAEARLAALNSNRVAYDEGMLNRSDGKLQSRAPAEHEE